MAIADEFSTFLKSSALRRISLPFDRGNYTFYRFGQDSTNIVVLLPGLIGSASIFFKMVQYLVPLGYNVIAAAYANADNIKDWVYSFDLFLDAVAVESVHLFGYGLGGYLASHYTAMYPKRVKSLALLNSFATTKYFLSDALITPNMVSSFMPHFALSNMITAGLPLPQTGQEKEYIDFIKKTLSELSRSDLAARLNISSTESSLTTPILSSIPVTLISSLNSCACPEQSLIDLSSLAAHARKVVISSSSIEMPPLTHSDEISSVLVAHLIQSGLTPQSLIKHPFTSNDDNQNIPQQDNSYNVQETDRKNKNINSSCGWMRESLGGGSSEACETSFKPRRFSGVEGMFNGLPSQL